MDIEITRENGLLKIKAIKNRKEVFTHNTRYSDIKTLSLEIIKNLNDLNIDYKNENKHLELKTHCKKLYELLFKDFKINDHEKDNLCFYLPNEIIYIPLQTLFDGNKWLNQTHEITLDIIPKRKIQRFIFNKLKAVILDNPTNDPNLTNNEAEYTKNALVENGFNTKHVKYININNDLLIEELWEYNLIYYIGHSETQNKNQGLVLNDDLFSLEEIKNADFSNCGLFILNSCESLFPNPDLNGKTIVNALLEKDVPNITGFMNKIDNTPASKAGKYLTEELAQGKTIGKAIKTTREYMKSLDDNIAWLSLMHFGDHNYTIIPVKPMQHQEHIINYSTINFTGRENVFNEIISYINKNNSGIINITGRPGIGKTAFISRLIQIFKGYHRKPLINIDDYKITYHFIKASDTKSTKTKTILISLIKQLTNEYIEMQEINGLKSKLKETINKNATTTKAVIILDGVDEADDEFLDYLPDSTVLKDNTFLIYTFRDELELKKEINNKLSYNEIKEIVLPPLSKQEAYEFLNKFYAEIDESLKSTIYEKSQGLPLYLKVLTEEYSSNEISYETLEEIPKGLEGFYDNLIEKLADSETGKSIHVLRVMFTLALAEDFLTIKEIEMINKVKTDDFKNLFTKHLSYGSPLFIKKTINDNGTTTEKIGLFHETFKDFLASFEQYLPDKIHNNFADFCLKNMGMNDYAREYLLNHLLKAKRFKTFRYYARKFYNSNYINGIRQWNIPLMEVEMLRHDKNLKFRWFYKRRIKKRVAKTLSITVPKNMIKQYLRTIFEHLP